MNLSKELELQLGPSETFIFDMDGTIVNLEKLNLSAFQDVIRKELNRELTNKEFQEHISGRGSLNGLEKYLQSIGSDPELAPLLQKSYREIKRDALVNRFHEVVTIMNGAPELLALLREMGKKTCLATSTGSEFAEIILSGTGLKKQFDVILTREDVKSIKPDPEMYTLAMKRLDSTPETTVIFEDSLNGILAAKEAKVYCIGIHNPGFNDDYVHQADTVITDFTSILNFLKVLGGD